MKKVTIYINNKAYQAEEGESVLQIALKNGLDIPHFCHHDDLPTGASCRTCLVETEKGVTTSCTLKATEGLKIKLDTVKVKKLRKENMELLLAGHREKCPKCTKGLYCQTSEIMKKHGVTGKKYQRDEPNRKIHKMGTAAEFDPALCINCNKCVEMCEKIGICFLHLSDHGSKTRIDYNKDPKTDCIYCGQCTVHCPVGAIREQSHIEQVEKALKDKNKIVIVQTAPSVRSSIGEEFGEEYGKDMTKKLYSAYRELGFDKVFDVNMGADITTMVEAEELIERIIKGGTMPMFTSCCPGWVKFVEFYHPELIPNLTTSRSPQIHSGGAYKTWWAEKEGIDPKKIVVVSVMPCTSKKYEAQHKKLFINGLRPVDYVLTTRELANLLRKHKIDITKLKESEVDTYGTYSGAAAIYGASGGVMEAALRTAHFMITGKPMAKLDLKEVRGIKGIKKAEIKIGKLKLKVAVVATAKNVRTIITELEKNPKAYDYIEVMACPGGCIGGGGQPIPSTNEIVKKRIAGLYSIDRKLKMRQAHENPVALEFMDYIKKQPKKKRDSLLYTDYSKKKKFE